MPEELKLSSDQFKRLCNIISNWEGYLNDNESPTSWEQSGNNIIAYTTKFDWSSRDEEFTKEKGVCYEIPIIALESDENTIILKKYQELRTKKKFLSERINDKKRQENSIIATNSKIGNCNDPHKLSGLYSELSDSSRDIEQCISTIDYLSKFIEENLHYDKDYQEMLKPFYQKIPIQM